MSAIEEDGSVAGGVSWRRGLPWLVGDHVLLREPAFSDAPALVEGLANPAVSRFMTPPPHSVTGFRSFIAWVRSARIAGRCYCHAIVDRATDRAIGLIQVRALEPSFATAEWGFALAPACWGKGPFLEGARMALDFAFRQVQVHRLEARASVENGRGNGVLLKLGAVREGTLRRSLEQGASRVDQVLWAVLAEEWMRSTVVTYDVRHVPEGPDVFDDAPPSTAREGPPWTDGLPVQQGRLGSLRELREGDGDGLLPLLRDEQVHRFTFPPPEDAAAFEGFRRWSQSARRAGRHVCYGMVPPGLDHPVGLIQFRALEPSFQTAEWGFVLGRPYWGTGLFQEMATLAIDFAFSTLGAHRLEARSAVANARACRVLRRLGAICEGSLRQSFLVGSRYVDDALYALLADDWQRLRATGTLRTAYATGRGAPEGWPPTPDHVVNR